MKLISQTIERDSSGAVTLQAHEPDDMWTVYNIIRRGDRLRCSTARKITTESATGSSTSHRVRLTLTIAVESIDFDAQAGELHLGGTVVTENKHVKLGAYHTLDLEKDKSFTMFKQEWDSVALDRIKEACDPSANAEVGAVVMQEGIPSVVICLIRGLANICLITEHMTILRQKIEISIPKKRRGTATDHQKARIHQTMLRHFNLEELKVVLIASPGFVGEGFINHVMYQAARLDDKVVMRSKSKLVLVHCSSGHVHSLNEVLKSPQVISQLSNTKFARESLAMDKFYRMLNDNEAQAWYGPKHVAAAVEKGAVGTLLISDSLFRSNNVGERKKYVKMVENVRSGGGEALIFSSMHESGTQLDQLTGIAAILTFPLPDLESDDEK
ncbi:Protein pelota [Neolecta irregularis DAH-3]|uniref:Protein DOM34 homolog n=1 Tax=Neolecta irregularis (strain DAH-3) TaxID=1198029 RepID=A0A1U7LPG5_NEOID|nr:Protein pelota [Neolecta irregularis DAH-3]|eukprot:OLL24518.1 Protein pelota [Neolecta irregularis DAH-3]